MENFKFNENYLKFIKLLAENEPVSKENLKKLLENCCEVLLNKKEIHEMKEEKSINNIYAALLYTLTQFTRYNQSSEDLKNFLDIECKIPKEKSEIIQLFYQNNFKNIRIQLLNIGAHLPNITDVKWKIDYSVKSNNSDEFRGPFFRISLKTEKFDAEIQKSNVEFIEFTCNKQELQDLISKLKDIQKHCQKISSGSLLIIPN